MRGPTGAVAARLVSISTCPVANHCWTPVLVREVIKLKMLSCWSSHLDDVRSWGCRRRSQRRFQKRFGGSGQSGGYDAFKTPPQVRGPEPLGGDPEEDFGNGGEKTQ